MTSGIGVARLQLLWTCRPAGALGIWVADVLYTYRPAGAMLVH